MARKGRRNARAYPAPQDQQTRDAATTRRDFANVANFLQFAEDGALADEANRCHYDKIKTAEHGPNWYGLPGMNTAASIRRVIESGWTDGADRVQRNADTITVPRLQSVRRRRVRGDRGDVIDMDRVYMGALDTAWTRTAKAACSMPPRVRIVTNMSTPCTTTAAKLFWRGAATLALSAALLEAGYSVQTMTAFTGRYLRATTGAGVYFAFTVITKDWRAPLDVPALAATSALAGFFRAHGFLALIKSAPTPIGYILGTPNSITADALPNDGAQLVTINDTDSITSEQTARAWIARQIAKLTDTGHAARAA